MNWLDSQDVIAIVAALLGLIAPAIGAVNQVRRWRSKRIGYRKQMDTAINRPGAPDSTLVLLRIENVGTRDIHPDDYAADDHGIKVVFAGRTVDDARAVPGPGAEDYLPARFYPSEDSGEPGLQTGADSVVLPRVRLDRKHHFKLLVWLKDGPAGSGVEVSGGLRDSGLVETRSQTIDENAPLFSRFALGTTALLACGLLLLSGIIVFWRQVPVGCAKGELKVVGSTAFRPTVEKIADRYMTDCDDSTVTVQAEGSNAVDWEAVRADGTSPPIVALSDGRKPSSVTGVREEMVAIVAFSLVVNDSVGISNLTTDQIRRIYAGEVVNWRELGGPDLPVSLVSRDADSGTRELLRQRILNGRGEPPFTSRDCVNKNSEDDEIVRCELGRTDQVLATVARVRGAIGYSELRTAATFQGNLHTLNIDGHAPSVQAIGAGRYRFTDIEYAYTNANVGAGSLTLSFLNYMIRGLGQDELKSFGHVPCYTPEGLTRCRP